MTPTMVLPVRVEGRLLRPLQGEMLGRIRADPFLVVDASLVQSLSGAGQAALVTAHRMAESRGGRLALWHPSTELITTLHASGLRHLLEHAPAQS